MFRADKTLFLFYLMSFSCCQHTGNANGFFYRRYPRKCVYKGVVDMLPHASEEPPSTVQVLAEVPSVLAVSCYSGFGDL